MRIALRRFSIILLHLCTGFSFLLAILSLTGWIRSSSQLRSDAHLECIAIRPLYSSFHIKTLWDGHQELGWSDDSRGNIFSYSSATNPRPEAWTGEGLANTAKYDYKFEGSANGPWGSYFVYRLQKLPPIDSVFGDRVDYIEFLIRFPAWASILLFLLLAITCRFLRTKTLGPWQHPKAGHCPQCRYNLHSHSPSDKCPECGTSVPASTPVILTSAPSPLKT